MKIELINSKRYPAEPLRGFWNKAEARKKEPCVSRPDLVAERNREIAYEIAHAEYEASQADSPHDAMCHEYWDRGLNCPHISKQDRDAVLSAVQNGDDIDPGWGQF